MWERFSRNLVDASRGALSAAAWACVLSVPPIIYWTYPRFGFRSILAIPAVCIVPILITAWYSLLAAAGLRRARGVDAVTAYWMFTLVSLGYSTAYSDLGATGSAAITHATVWACSGIVTGILWARSASHRGLTVGLPLMVFGALIAFLWARESEGTPAALSSAAMVPGFTVGYYVSAWFSPLTDHLRRVKYEIAKTKWYFAAFVFGYLTIVYIFAGLYAVAWTFDHSAIAPFTDQPALSDFLIVSLSTVSTGYAEARANSLPTKLLASLEVLLALFWVTVVFARLAERADDRIDSDFESAAATNPSVLQADANTPQNPK